MAHFGGRRGWLLGLIAALLFVSNSSPVLAASSPTFTISGIVYFDQNGNGRRDAGEPLLSRVRIEEQVNGQFVPASQSQADGGYTFANLTPSTYTIEAAIINPEPTSGVTGGQVALASPPRTITVTNADQSGIDFGLTLPATPHDVRFFPQTGYRVDNDLLWNYFQARGGVTTFGYPVSRAFPFLGFWTQIFQRQILQVGGAPGGVHELNLLDPDLMPITSLNFSTFPPYDASLTQQAPPPSAANYADAIVAFVQQHAPDRFDGQPVNFYRTFTTTVSLQTAYPTGGGNPVLLPLLNLEIWGVPTSQPAADPKNHHFVYLRFQRGIMHYDAGCQCTQGILLADTFKSVLTGKNLPADVALQMATSPYLKLDDPLQVDAVARVPVATASGATTVPKVQGWTDLAYAFLPATS
jgi:hypothetical protein